jgi:hypothetical protein
LYNMAYLHWLNKLNSKYRYLFYLLYSGWC